MTTPFPSRTDSVAPHAAGPAAANASSSTIAAATALTTMRLVIIESPYAGDVQANIAYARRCVRDSLGRGEAPIASHLLYTQPDILDDDNPAERQWGIDAGLAWRVVAHAMVVYTDLGISRGMLYGIDAAEAAGIPVEYRTIAAREGHRPPQQLESGRT